MKSAAVRFVMNDTSPEMEQKQFEMMMELGAARRTELACEMYLAARSFIEASLPENLSQGERLRAIVAKMYGREFSRSFFADVENNA